MRFVVAYLLFFLLISSCDTLDEVGQAPMRSDIDGKWALQSARCFCFFPDDFDFSAHQLEFDTAANEVSVENSGDTFFVTATGTYSVTIQNDRLTINDDLVYTYELEGDTLILTFVDDPQIADDEVALFYSRL